MKTNFFLTKLDRSKLTSSFRKKNAQSSYFFMLRFFDYLFQFFLHELQLPNNKSSYHHVFFRLSKFYNWRIYLVGSSNRCVQSSWFAVHWIWGNTGAIKDWHLSFSMTYNLVNQFTARKRKLTFFWDKNADFIFINSNQKWTDLKYAIFLINLRVRFYSSWAANDVDWLLLLLMNSFRGRQREFAFDRIGLFL